MSRDDTTLVTRILPPTDMGEAIQMTNIQLQELIAALTGAAGGRAAGAAAVMGQLAPCQLGKDRIKRVKKFEDWIRDAEAKIKVLKLNTDEEKIDFIKSCAGHELLELWMKEVRIRFETIPRDDTAQPPVPEQPAHTYAEILKETRSQLMKIVSQERAVIDLFRIEQKDRHFTEFLSEVEDQEKLCQISTKPITSDSLRKMAILAGLKDRTLAEKAIGEGYSITQLIQAAISRETSRANVDAMQGLQKNSAPTYRVQEYGELDPEAAEVDARINLLRAEMEELEVHKLRQAGKYSQRYKPSSNESDEKQRCKKCTFTHRSDRRCPADGRSCDSCGQEGHFAKSPLCKKSGNAQSSSNLKKKQQTGRQYKVENENTEASEEEEGEETDPGKHQPLYRLQAQNVGIKWPGIRKDAETGSRTYKITTKRGNKMRKSKWVHIKVGGFRQKLFCDTGSKKTIITPSMYHPAMGQVVASDCYLRAWGSKDRLDVKGMFQTDLKSTGGGYTTTWVYVVDGDRPEPLLGEGDAEDLGIIVFNPEGMDTSKVNGIRTSMKQQKAEVKETGTGTGIPNKLRKAGIKVETSRPPTIEISDKDQLSSLQIVDRHVGLVFSDRIGCLQIDPVKLQYEPNFVPVQPPRYGIPYRYQDRVSAHLKNLKRDGVIEDVDPAEVVDCVLNVAISEKKENGAIRMNIDMRPCNEGAKLTKYHVPLAEEVRHSLAGAQVFSELDMGNAFHQVRLHEDSQVVFRTHEGLHRMKRLFFGPTNSTGIFHHQIQKAFTGVKGCITIHDNILVHGETVQEHNKALKETLARAQEKGITLKLGKSTFCSPEVTWFGRLFTASGISADPGKVETIIKAGVPRTCEDVRSLLQAAAYNAKFAFDHNEDQTYEEVTAPLRELLVKNARFSWNEFRQASYEKLVRMMNDKTVLAPFDPKKTIHIVGDASPEGIAATIYQEHPDGTWKPVDHSSRALTPQEKRWNSQIDWEALAKVFGMTVFRQYIVGTHFFCWGDHKPLVPLFNNLNKPAPARVSRLRNMVVDLTFTDKHIPGHKNPADYASRHPVFNVDQLSEEEKCSMIVDDGQEISIMRVLASNLPPAVTVDLLQEAVARDKDYRELSDYIKNGQKPTESKWKDYTNSSTWPELSVLDNLICRGNRIVIPGGEMPGHSGSIRQWLVQAAHSGHMGTSAMKRLMRDRVWFPGMDSMIEDCVKSCLPCVATTPDHQRDPLKPNPLPAELWETVYVDHWGPTRDGEHMLVFIDAFSKYPEVIGVMGTSADDNIEAFAQVFARHGVPRLLRSDNGAPFNGKESHLLTRYLKYMGVKHKTNFSAEDPESSGQVEAFMKHLGKVYHTAEISGQDPRFALQNHLMQYRATPHPSTGKPPAELLFGRQFRINLPDIRQNITRSRSDMQEAREQDSQAKARMKRQKDSNRNVKENKIQQGDLVLLRRKSTKHMSRYDPDPFIAVQVTGSQIVGERKGTTKTRDAQKWKLYEGQEWDLRQNPEHRGDPDIGAPVGSNEQALPLVPLTPHHQGGPQFAPEARGAQHERPTPRGMPKERWILGTQTANPTPSKRTRKEVDYRKLHLGDWKAADGEYKARHRRQGERQKPY